MNVAVFSAKNCDRVFLDRANREYGHSLRFFDARLAIESAMLADGSPVVCAFVNDALSEPVMEHLAANGTRHVALRSAGFNHVDLAAANRLGLVVSRVPAYSPHAVAEHTVGLMLTLSRQIHRAFARVREGARDCTVGLVRSRW